MSETTGRKKSFIESFVRAMFGLDTGRRLPEQRPVPAYPLGQMMRELLKVDEEGWGLYAFSRDPLERRFSDERKIELTRKANQCGREYARASATEYGTEDPAELARLIGLTVERRVVPRDMTRVLFAEFKAPNHIYLYTDAVSRAEESIEEPGVREVLTDRLDIERVLLAHEMFHYIEEKHKKDIFTRTERVDLPTIPPFKNRSPIICLGELAAMEFTRTLNKLPYSPYLMDVFLTYGYSKEGAASLFEDIMNMAKLALPDPNDKGASDILGSG